MCSRFLLRRHHLREVYARLGIVAARDAADRFNIAPGTAVTAIRALHGSAGQLGDIRWGLPAMWGRNVPIINARSETAGEKPAFRDALRARRCILPASGYYEWEKRGAARRPWLFQRKENALFGFAALWSETAPHEIACAVLTTAANELMQPLHDRMPVALAPDEWEAWLDPAITAPDALTPWLQPASAGQWERYRVTPKVGNVRFEDAACIEPYPESDDTGPQLSLGL